MYTSLQQTIVDINARYQDRGILFAIHREHHGYYYRQRNSLCLCVSMSGGRLYQVNAVAPPPNFQQQEQYPFQGGQVPVPQYYQQQPNMYQQPPPGYHEESKPLLE